MKRRILLVDDEVAVLLTLKAILGKLRPEPVTGTSKGTVTPDQTL